MQRFTVKLQFDGGGDLAGAYNLSVDWVLNIAKTITTIKVKLPSSGETMTKTMLLTQKHKSIEKLFDKNFWRSLWVTHCRGQEIAKNKRKTKEITEETGLKNKK
ncbi:MAG: hypothetical protein LBD23_02990 [Oscillospiraceae bacterium]|jgi:hypothetical protein|nr:hypothetical protein [Oscillospiraceae bacterium]